MCSACVNPFLYGWLNENISNQVTDQKKYNINLSFSGLKMLLATQMLSTKQPNIDIGTKFATKPFCHSTLSVIVHIVSVYQLFFFLY